MSSIDKENRLQAICFHDSPPLLLSPNGCYAFFLQNLVALLGFGGLVWVWFWGVFLMLFAGSRQQFELVGRGGQK